MNTLKEQYGFRTGQPTYHHCAIFGLSLVLLIGYCMTYRAKAYACPQETPVTPEIKHQRTAYSVSPDLGLPNRREPGGTR